MIIGNAVIAAGASSGETEEKTVTITENCTTEVTPTVGKTMTKVTITTAIPVPTLEASKEVTYTENGTFTIEPSEGKDAIEEVSVTVNVPNPLLAHTVTVVRDGVTKYVFSIADGERISAPPTPSESGKAFFGWWTTANMIGGTKISFPYTPTADITIYEIVTTLTGMTWQTVNAIASSNYGSFNINFEIENIKYMYIPNNFSKIEIGRAVVSSSQVENFDSYFALFSEDPFVIKNKTTGDENTSFEMTLEAYAGKYGYNTVTINNPVFTFISGADITNQSLVNWLISNAIRTA